MTGDGSRWTQGTQLALVGHLRWQGEEGGATLQQVQEVFWARSQDREEEREGLGKRGIEEADGRGSRNVDLLGSDCRPWACCTSWEPSSGSPELKGMRTAKRRQLADLWIREKKGEVRCLPGSQTF